LKASTRFHSADVIRGPEPPTTYNRPDVYATPADARIAGMGVAVVQSMRTHIAESRVPNEQLELPSTLKPGLHVGRHEAPLGKAAEQLPAPPFLGGVEASHDWGEQACDVTGVPPSIPQVNVGVPLAVYPSEQPSVHDCFVRVDKTSPFVQALRVELPTTPVPKV
jgi:hypothetical protein